METVISCTKTKEWNGKPIYTVGLSDGQGGESFAVNIPIGTPLSDLIIEPSQWGNKIKLKRNASGGGFSGAAKSRGGNESFALAYSKDLVVGGKVELKDLLKTADKLYDWLEGKKQTSAPATPVPTNGTTVIQKQVHPTVAQNQPTDDLPF